MDNPNNNLLFFHSKSALTPLNPRDHFHNTYEFYLLINGDVEYVVGDATYSLQPYDLLLIKASVYHYAKLLSDKPYERFCINFTLEDVAEELRPILNETRVRYPFQNNKLMKNLYAALDALKETASYDDTLTFCRQIVNMLLLQLKYAPSENENAQITHPTLSKILNYIDEHLHETLNANDIAEIFFVSTSWISYIFKKHFHIPYKQYVNHRKMLHAQQLIQSGTPPTQTALLCGFEEYATFYRQYKRHFGTSPQTDKKAT